MMESREVCYSCYRPQTSCMCAFVRPIETNTKFIILMHPKEFRKTKNGTGHLTNQSLPNSQLHVGINFKHNEAIQTVLKDTTYEPFLLYPHKDAIWLDSTPLKTDKKIAVFIIDSTWACSKKILRENAFLQKMKTLSFQHNKKSNFHIKTQPQEECLSTIESTQCLIQYLNEQSHEDLTSQHLEDFLHPFNKMVEYQLQCAQNNKIRFRPSH